MAYYHPANAPQVQVPPSYFTPVSYSYGGRDDGAAYPLASPTSPWSPGSSSQRLSVAYSISQKSMQSPLLDHGPPPEHRQKAKFRLRDVGARWWIYEIGASIIALSLAGVIFYHLKKLSNEPTTRWTWPWGVASVLQFAVTVMKAAMMVPVASALGQLKWHHFRRFQKLSEMEIFDESSRGILGSIRLLFRLKFWSVLSSSQIVKTGWRG